MPAITVIGTNDWAAAAQQVPQSLTAVTGPSLDRAGITSVPDLQRIVPNLSLAQAGLRSYSDNYTMRGLGNTEFLSSPAVALYVDDAPFGDTMSYATDLLTVEQVTVYRGPQGSRFGKNSEAGVIHVVTRQPTDRFEGDVSATLASFNTQTYRVSAMGPLVKGKLLFSLAGQSATSDGFIRNTLQNTHADEREALNGRGALRWMPNEIWDVNFSATADHFDDGLGIVSLSGNPHETATETDPQVKRDANSQSLRVRGTWEKIAVTSITTRQDSRFHPLKIDPDFSPLPGNTGILNWAQIQWSEELRVQPNAPGDRWEWHTGVFFAATDTDIHRPSELFLPQIPLTARDVIDSQQTVNTYALFGEVTRKIGSRWDVTLGLRLDYTTAEIHRTRDFTLGSPPPVDADTGFFNAAPKLTLAHHVSDTMLIYGSTGLGFKPGGFSPLIDPPRSPKFETETVWASEVGVKSTWLDDRITANASLFFNAITDYQVEQIVPPGFDNTVVNAPRARSFGAEVELTARPTSGLELSGFLGWTDVELESYTDPFISTTVRDTHPPFVAAFNAGVAAQYNHKSGLFGRVGATFLGDTYADAANTPAFKQPAYGLLSARLGFERGNYSIQIFGENLTDTDYFMKKIPALNAGAPGRPQTFGVMVSAQF